MRGVAEVAWGAPLATARFFLLLYEGFICSVQTEAYCALTASR